LSRMIETRHSRGFIAFVVIELSYVLWQE
jgi:hypothetical protein